MPVSLKAYYRHFVGVSGGLATLVGAFPLVSEVFQERVSVYVFPPLGQLSIPARVLAVFLGLCITFLVFFMKDADFFQTKKARRRALYISLSAALIGALAYMTCHFFFVKQVEYSFPVECGCEKTVILVSVGIARTPAAKERYDRLPDEEMLRKVGTSDEKIRTLWTPLSVLVARLLLFISYVLTLGCFVATGSLGVLSELLELS
jgi:hypothetical protein